MSTLQIDKRKLPIDPKAYYSATGEWQGWRKLCGNNLICDECGNEICECEKMKGVSLLVTQLLDQVNIPLTMAHVNELAVSHPHLLVDLHFEDMSKTVPSQKAFAQVEALGHKLKGIYLSENVDQLRKMGLLPK